MSFRLNSVSFHYPGLKFHALDQVSFDFPSGSFISVVGANGSGKSTLLKLLCGILTPDSGSVFFDGREFSTISAGERAKKVAYVPQKQDLLFNMTVEELVSTGRTPYLSWMGLLSEHDQVQIDTAIKKADISHLKGKPIAQLSGGEQQRVWIARALAQQAGCIILDEPTAHLDLKHQIEIFRLLKDLQIQTGCTIITACHDLTLAASFSTHAVILRCGQLYKSGFASAVLTETAIRDAFEIPVTIRHDNDFIHVQVAASEFRTNSDPMTKP